MIYTERTITVKSGKSSIDDSVILFRGDRGVEVRFLINETKFKYSSSTNLIEKTHATYGQLVIDKPDGSDIFSEITDTKDGAIVFTITADMIDEIPEVGFYTFQIRLYDDEKTSRVSIPPIERGIEVREPLALEGEEAEAEAEAIVGEGAVGYSIVRETNGVVDTFDADGNYNKTNWKSGDIISEDKLNKIEDALFVVNDKIDAIDTGNSGNSNSGNSNVDDNAYTPEANWVVASVSGGVVHKGITKAIVTENLIQLTEDLNIYFDDLDGTIRYFWWIYQSDGTYTATWSDWHTEDTVIPAQANRAIRIEVRHVEEKSVVTLDELEPYITVGGSKPGGDTTGGNTTGGNTTGGNTTGNNTAQSIPSYWESHLNSKINTIKNLQNQIGYNGTSFAFITDVHWDNNTKNSPALLEKVMDECDIPYYFDGGDFAANPSGRTKEQQVAEIEEYRRAFSRLEDRVLRTIGNHDDNSIDNLYSATITDKEMYSIVARQNSKYQHMKNGETGLYYYIDDEFHKIRYITLNCCTDFPYSDNGSNAPTYSGMWTWGYRQGQIDWFADVALNVPSSEWSVVVCSHIAISAGLTIRNDAIVMNILQAFKDKKSYSGSDDNSGTIFRASKTVDFTNKGGDVICWIAGHAHIDMDIALPSDITFKELVTLNDSLNVKSGAPTKTVGTATENAFDIFTIDKENRTVKVTRIGAGSDREFTY